MRVKEKIASMGLTATAMTVGALATVGLQAAPAAAATGTTFSVNTTDSGGAGGTGIFWYDGNGAQPPGKSVIAARDNQADGLRVHVEVIWNQNGGALMSSTLENANGAGTLIDSVVNIPDGTSVKLKVCLRDGPSGALQYCNTHNGIA